MPTKKAAAAPAANPTDQPYPLDGEQAVLVTTEYRGVFFGYCRDIHAATLSLRRARNCLYWPKEQKGFLGLASNGPVSGSRIGPPADMPRLPAITCVAICSPESVKRWESQPWS